MRFFFFFRCSGAVRGLAFTSLGGGREMEDLDFSLETREPEERGLDLDLELEEEEDLFEGLDEGFDEEPLFGAIVGMVYMR